MELLCATCGHHNPVDRRFCLACNSYLGPDSKLVGEPEKVPEASDDTLVSERVEPFPGRDAFPDDEPPLPLGSWSRGPQPPDRAEPERLRQVSSPPTSRVVTAPCPQCSTQNRPELRFCRKCGYLLERPSTTAVAPPPVRRSWWVRLIERFRLEGSRAGRASYRRSLPIRVRLVRWIGTTVLLLLVAAVLAAFYTWGYDVTTWRSHFR